MLKYASRSVKRGKLVGEGVIGWAEVPAALAPRNLGKLATIPPRRADPNKSSPTLEGSPIGQMLLYRGLVRMEETAAD